MLHFQHAGCQLIRGIAFKHRHFFLQNDLPGVYALVHEMDGRSAFFFAAFQDSFVHPFAVKPFPAVFRDQGRMDIDDLVSVSFNDLLRKHFHVSGQHDHVCTAFLQFFHNLLRFFCYRCFNPGFCCTFQCECIFSAGYDLHDMGIRDLSVSFLVDQCLQVGPASRYKHCYFDFFTHIDSSFAAVYRFKTTFSPLSSAISPMIHAFSPASVNAFRAASASSASTTIIMPIPILNVENISFGSMLPVLLM